MALRDDSTKRSLSIHERKFTRYCATNGNDILRQDGREPGETRKLRLTYSRSHARSECTVELGNTKCLCGITAELLPPSPDRPNNGMLNFQVDLSAMASLSYDAGLGSLDSSQRLLSTKLSRVMERSIREGNALDTEALCVQSGKWVWSLDVDVTVFDDSGNLLDAALLAVIAALRHFRLPEVSYLDDDSPMVLHSDNKEPTPLPLHHTPVCISFGLFGDTTGATGSSKVSAILDPTDREELVTDGSITFAFNRHKELCALDFNGGCELQISQLLSCARLAEKRGQELCVLLEKSLKDADAEAKKDRLERLKSTNLNGTETMLSTENVPFLETRDVADMDIGSLDDINEIGIALTKAAVEDEKYRARALDYAVGHEAAKTRDTSENKSMQNDRNISGGSLLQAMISSASKGMGKQNNDTFHSSTDPEAQQVTKVDVSGSVNKKTDEEVFHKSDRNMNGGLVPSVDSDDEEETLALHSEFGSSKIGTAEKSSIKQEDQKLFHEKNDDVDLLQAVKKSKSRKKKNRKK